MLEKINTKKNVNGLSCVQKNDVINTKNFHIVTRQGTKIGSDNPRISKKKRKMSILIHLKKNKHTKKQPMYSKNLHDKNKLTTLDIT